MRTKNVDQFLFSLKAGTPYTATNQTNRLEQNQMKLNGKEVQNITKIVFCELL